MKLTRGERIAMALGLILLLAVLGFVGRSDLAVGAATYVDISEDGSGVQYVGDQEVRTFPADTFAWRCEELGNEALYDALDAESPEGWRFGAHEGDGSDMGFWQEDAPED